MAKHESLLTREFFQKNYVEQRLSYPKIKSMLHSQGTDVSLGTLLKYARLYGLSRSRSEAKRNRVDEPVDYNVSLMTESILESVDGFLLGDGHINPNPHPQIKSARLTCGLEYEEFCRYLMGHFSDWHPTIAGYAHGRMSKGIVWQGRTLNHPDFHQQLLRWYANEHEKWVKRVPGDVRLTPKSVLLWYLGDGSVVCDGSANTIILRLSTDGFEPACVETLAARLREKGILCHRNNDNRIYVEARGIAAFFNLIGRTSPVECYKYKFDIPEWRFCAKRMRDVAQELNVNYKRLMHLVKIGKATCLRASEKGRPRFLPAHIENLKRLITEGDLY